MSDGPEQPRASLTFPLLPAMPPLKFLLEKYLTELSWFKRGALFGSGGAVQQVGEESAVN